MKIDLDELDEEANGVVARSTDPLDPAVRCAATDAQFREAFDVDDRTKIVKPKGGS